MEDISVDELKERKDKNEPLIVIDVREEWEYEEFNIGAKLIPLATLPDAIAELATHKHDEIIIHCKSGKRSANAQAFLKQNGFTNVRNLTGGMEAWKAKHA
ncbi:MAG TPA: NADH oxidase [Bacteroidetes bacterium]|nr:NADH oxidase [Bacteroidota bacterium]